MAMLVAFWTACASSWKKNQASKNVVPDAMNRQVNALSKWRIRDFLGLGMMWGSIIASNKMIGAAAHYAVKTNASIYRPSGATYQPKDWRHCFVRRFLGNRRVYKSNLHKKIAQTFNFASEWVYCGESFLRFPSRYFQFLLRKRLRVAVQLPPLRTSSNWRVQIQ